jgi:hypothetical protein
LWCKFNLLVAAKELVSKREREREREREKDKDKDKNELRQQES